jgi:hypothetical protein
MTAVGEDLSTTTSATLVDNLGVDIPGVNAIPVGANLVISGGGTIATVSADAFDLDGNDVDALTAIRRVKLSRPTGDLISQIPFTVSSPPDVRAGGNGAVVYLEATPPGTADGGAKTGTYSLAAGAGGTVGFLSITSVGADLKGVSSIDFWESTTGAIVVGTTTLTLPGVDWTVNAAGTTLTIPAAVITAKGVNWFTPGSGNRHFRLHTPATTPDLITPNITAEP